MSRIGGLFILNVYKDAPNFEINLLVTRESLLLPNWTHIPELAPSSELHQKYIEWTTYGLWKQKQHEYKKLYLQEILLPSKRKYITKILKRLFQGKNVALGCTCDDHSCHLTVIAEQIAKQNIKVVFGRDIRELQKEQNNKHDVGDTGIKQGSLSLFTFE